MNQLSFDQQVRIVAALTEGCSIRATERLTDCHRDTVMRLGIKVGMACERLHNRLMVGLHVNVLQLDELWAFIGKKQKRVIEEDEPEKGDNYTWLALDANKKAIIAYVVGKRTAEQANQLVADLRARIINRPQITSDGLAAYPDAIEAAFGRAGVDYAMLQKVYQSDTSGQKAEHRYSPGAVAGIRKEVVFGNPDESLISTSYVERVNLTVRMHTRRFTRLTNAFSKKAFNHQAAVSLHVGFYNYCRVHETLRVTPAMELGVTDHIWSVGELIERALSTPPTAPPKPPQQGPERDPETGLLPGRKPFQLRVIRGGKMGTSRLPKKV